jgi:hypothetical protein
VRLNVNREPRPGQPLIVALDTNVFREHQRPSNTLRVIAKELRAGWMRLAVPEVVIREAANSRREEVRDVLAKADRALDKLADVGALSERPDVKQTPRKCVMRLSAACGSYWRSWAGRFQGCPTPTMRTF